MPHALETVWKQCLEHLERTLEQGDFDTWIRPLQLGATANGGELHLLAPNQYVRERVEERHAGDIRRFLEHVNQDHCRDLTIGVGSVAMSDADTSDGAVAGAAGNAPPSGRTAPVSRAGHGLKPKFTFDSFIVGKSNKLAHAAARQVADNPEAEYSPLLIYGATGLGKTHLMHAIGNHIREKSPEKHIAYLQSEGFVNDVVNGIRHNRMPDVKEYYRSVDVLLIDDIQFFANKPSSLEEFFYLFEALNQKGHLIVLTCDKYPREIENLPERLITRCTSGVFMEIEPPELETRAAILESKAAVRGENLPRDVLFFLAERSRSSVRELEGILAKVLISARFHHTPVTIDLCRKTLQDVLSFEARNITIENILKAVAEYFNLRPQAILSKSRQQSVVRPRQIAMALARELTDLSFPEIGEAFGNRNHTTVLHACRKVEELRGAKHSVNTDYQNLQRALST